MSRAGLDLPLIDISPYLKPGAAEKDREKVITEIRDACISYGFFQLTGHGIPLQLQREFLAALDTLFYLPKEEKLSLSFLNSPCRRGYEASGMTLRDGDAMPDSKEAYYISHDFAVPEPPGFYGPNVWPPLPEGHFRKPAESYFRATEALGRTLWEILLQGIGRSPSVMDIFAKRPIVQMKSIRYPPATATLPGQFGVGAHKDVGGVTVLLQQPGHEGLEVLLDDPQGWVTIPALEDVFIINCGDIVNNWTGGRYKSPLHRVVNKADHYRLSCATFWHGDAGATNPFDPDDLTTVGQHLVKRFRKQFSVDKKTVEDVLGKDAV